MALSNQMLRGLKSVAKPGMLVASMGYPDVISPPEIVKEAVGDATLDYRNDSAELVRWHGTEHARIPTAESVFKALGLMLEVFDIAAHRGGELIRDLNYQLPSADLERYDIVLDVGTLEHCFNIGQAAFNMAGLVKEGGIILHENPFNWGNHGFYGISPTWYHDFYGQNGFEVLDMKMIATDGQEVTGVPPTRRFGFFAAETNMCVAVRRRVVQPLNFPVQSKYKKMIQSKTMMAIAGE